MTHGPAQHDLISSIVAHVCECVHPLQTVCMLLLLGSYWKNEFKHWHKCPDRRSTSNHKFLLHPTKHTKLLKAIMVATEPFLLSVYFIISFSSNFCNLLLSLCLNYTGCLVLTWFKQFSFFALQHLHSQKPRDGTVQISCWLPPSFTSGDIYLTGQRDLPYPTAQLTTVSLVIETGLGAQPCITALALLQEYDTWTDPLRSEPLWCWEGVAGKGKRKGQRERTTGSLRETLRVWGRKPEWEER